MTLVVTRCQLCHSPMPTERPDCWCADCSENTIEDLETPLFDLDPLDSDCCDQCGGDGVVQLSDTPELWGEDCFCEIDRLVTCPSCLGKGISREVGS